MNNAWNFNGNNRNLNNNNVNNANIAQAVSNLSQIDFTTEMNDEKRFVYLYDLMMRTRKNKRRGRDAVEYEANWPALLVRDMEARKDRTFRIDTNFTFLTSRPRWREIFATCYGGRMVDHEVCDVLIPLCERVLSFYTFNNRKGKGSMAAINQVMEHIYEVSNGYAEPTRIIKLDLKGYFPNALWDYAEQYLIDILNNSNLSENSKTYLRWLIMITTHCNPAAHCELRTPRHLWHNHIEPEKSLFEKPEGVGAAIGRLLWQTAMGLYINDEIKWLTEECGIRTVCFVDDIVMVVPDRLHCYALSLIPELRKRFAVKNVRLNEKKFYDQPFRHGLEFLGSHIRPNRLHLNNKTYGNALDTIAEMNELTTEAKYRLLNHFVSMVNSYTGLLKNRTDYKRLLALKSAIGKDWWHWLCWDSRRLCVVCREGFTERERLNQKYNLHLKSISKPR